MPFRVEIQLQVECHLRYLTKYEQRLVLDEMSRQLLHEPDVRTRNRKPMEPNPLAAWELRIGDLRVYYDLYLQPEKLVVVRAIGKKDRSRVFIGGEEYRLWNE